MVPQLILDCTRSYNMIQQTPKLGLTVFLLFQQVSGGFIPGKTCGVLSPITTVEDATELRDGDTCVLVKDQKSFAKLKKREASKISLMFLIWISFIYIFINYHPMQNSCMVPGQTAMQPVNGVEKDVALMDLERIEILLKTVAVLLPYLSLTAILFLAQV